MAGPGVVARRNILPGNCHKLAKLMISAELLVSAWMLPVYKYPITAAASSPVHCNSVKQKPLTWKCKNGHKRNGYSGAASDSPLLLRLG